MSNQVPPQSSYSPLTHLPRDPSIPSGSLCACQNCSPLPMSSKMKGNLFSPTSQDCDLAGPSTLPLSPELGSTSHALSSVSLAFGFHLEAPCMQTPLLVSLSLLGEKSKPTQEAPVSLNLKNSRRRQQPSQSVSTGSAWLTLAPTWESDLHSPCHRLPCDLWRHWTRDEGGGSPHMRSSWRGIIHSMAMAIFKFVQPKFSSSTPLVPLRCPWLWGLCRN